MPIRLNEIYRPTDIDSAVRLLEEVQPARPAMLPPRPTDSFFHSAKAVIDVSQLGLAPIALHDGRVVAGAASRLADLPAAPCLAGEQYAALHEAARLACHPGLRRLVSLGGLWLEERGAMDLRLVLMTLEAVVTIQTPAGQEDRTLLERLEGSQLPVAVSFACMPAGGTGLASARVARAPGAQPIVAAAARVVAEGGICRLARLAIGGVQADLRRVKEAEERLEGQALTEAALAEVCGEAAMPATVSDFRGSAEYRQTAGRVVLRRAATAAWRQANRS
jgi:CO/xanthine dehydrogenase FAD-binding subunit